MGNVFLINDNYVVVNSKTLNIMVEFVIISWLIATILYSIAIVKETYIDRASIDTYLRFMVIGLVAWPLYFYLIFFGKLPVNKQVREEIYKDWKDGKISC